MIQGKVIGVSVDGNYYPCELNSSLDINIEMINASSKAKGYFEDFENGKKTWSISLDGRLNALESWGSSFNNILVNALHGSNEFEVAFQMKSNPETELFFRFWDKARLNNANLSASNQGYANGSYTFQGCGRLNFEIKNVTDILRAMEIEDDKDIVVDMS